MMKIGLAAIAALTIALPASAQVVVDGSLDAAYGAAKSTVTYDPAAPNGQFGSPGTINEGAGYSIFLTSDANNVYGLIQADRTPFVIGSNLYFNLDPQNGTSTDLGFEITNDRAFRPGVTGYVENLAGLNFAVNSTNTAIEFSIANSLFTSAIPGISYRTGQEFAAVGGNVTIGLSQSFGYAVAGGASYGANRLGSVTIGGAGAVPEPASWAMMIGGFGFVGGAMRRRSVKAKVRFA